MLALVIGAGFIGTHVARALAERQIPTRVLNRSPMEGERRDRLGGAETIVGDASVRPTLRRALDGVDHVYFCAGGLMPAEAQLDPATHAALELPPLLSVLEELREHPRPGLTYVSSGGTVYGIPESVPVREDHPTEPLTAYGITKLAGEKYVGMYARAYGLRARVLRCSNVYGELQPTGRGQGFVAAALQALRDGTPVPVYGDGLNIRDFVYARDVARIMIDLAARDDGPLIVNVGSGTGVTLWEILDAVELATGVAVETEVGPDRGFDVRRIVLDVSALRALLPYEPTPLDVGIEAQWSGLYRGAVT